MRARARNKAKRKYQKLLRIAEARMNEARQTLLAVLVENHLALDAIASAEFGTLPDSVVSEVASLSRTEQIEAFLLRVLTADTIGETGVQPLQAS